MLETSLPGLTLGYTYGGQVVFDRWVLCYLLIRYIFALLVKLNYAASTDIVRLCLIMKCWATLIL